MYLEERVEQLEHLAADQGRQIETVAKSLADLTVDVRLIRQDMNDGFKRVDEQFKRVDERFDKLKQRLDKLEQRFDEMHQTQQVIIQRFDDMHQTQQLILKLITDKLT